MVSTSTMRYHLTAVGHGVFAMRWSVYGMQFLNAIKNSTVNTLRISTISSTLTRIFFLRENNLI